MSDIVRRIRRPLGVVRRYLRSLLRLGSIEQQVRDLQAANGQLASLVRELGIALPPPPHLQRRVVGVYAADFLDSGHAVVRDIDRVLAGAGQAVGSFGSIHDFGCGCGRVVRALRSAVGPSVRLTASDIDSEAIEWCQRDYAGIAEFEVNGHEPPAPYPDATFDFLFSISIVTHLPEAMQIAWLRELRRLVKPGGYVLLSVHGPKHYGMIPSGRRGEMSTRGFVYLKTGETAGLPEFYQTAFHSRDYVERVWSEYFEIVAYKPLAIGSHQDAVLCRVPAN